MDFSPQQAKALEQIAEWHERARDKTGPQIFRLFGYAGTGKTTIAKEMQNICGKTQYGSFTGKAALVLKNKGCGNAMTIHSMIYRSMDKSKVEHDRLKDEMEAIKADPAQADKVKTLAAEIERMRQDLQSPHFTLNEHAFDRKWDELAEQYVYISPPALICIDECSMVDKRIGQDLESFGIPILVLGDPAQLPPVRGAGYFTGTETEPCQPDILLTEVHRQAADNPVLQIATACRTQGMPNIGEYGDSRIAFKTDLAPADWLAADQILCGKNDTRNKINRWVRNRRGYTGLLPNVGERLVCLRNNHDLGLLNGSLWEPTLVEDMPKDERFFKMTLRSLDDENAEPVTTIVHKKPFLGQEFEDHYERRDADEFDFGHCLTTHKAQGSEWANVIYIDEWPGYRNADTKRRHQYTGVTRAAKRITVIKDGQRG